MTARTKTNFERLLECTSPRVPIQYYTERRGSSSSSVSGVKAEDEEVRKPRIVLEDIWKSCDEWSSYGRGVPLSIEGTDDNVINYYAPYLSAIQIYTIKPFTDDPRSSATGIDGTETGSAEPESYGKRISNDDHLGYLFFQYDETAKPCDRSTLTLKFRDDLSKQHPGLYTLTSSDLSPYSWISIAWYPIYAIGMIPSVRSRKELSACFLTYHSLTPNFPETVGKDDKGNEQGGSNATVVELPSFAAVAYKATGDVWIMPGTSDNQKIEMREEAASSWLRTRRFFHSDYNFFMSKKFLGAPK